MRTSEAGTDAELMSAFLEGKDEAAFEILVRRHEPRVMRICERVLRDEHGARDAAQAVFLVLARKGATLDLDRPLGPWLNRVATGIARSARRERQARREREIRAIPVSAGGRPFGKSEEALLELLDGELDGLPENYRRSLVLFHVEGRSLEETAASLGSPAGTVGAWLSRGRRLLRARLALRGAGALSGGMLLALLAREAQAASRPEVGFARYVAAQASGKAARTAVFLTKGIRAMIHTPLLKAAGAALIAVGAFFASQSLRLWPNRAAASESHAAVAWTAPEAALPEASLEGDLAPIPDSGRELEVFLFPPTSDLVGHWKLDDEKGSKTAVDATGHADGRLVGGAEFGEGKLGGGLRCDGTGGHVVLSSTEELDKVQEGSYSVAAWFKAENVPPGKESANDANYGIVMKTGWHLGLSYTNEKKFVMTHWLVGEKPEEPLWAGTGTWDDEYEPGQWHHLVGTVDRSGGKVAIYVDGELKNTAEFTPNAEARGYGKMPWKIGIGSPGAKEWSWPARGSIDEVRIYGRALSAAEAKSVYESK